MESTLSNPRRDELSQRSLRGQSVSVGAVSPGTRERPPPLRVRRVNEAGRRWWTACRSSRRTNLFPDFRFSLPGLGLWQQQIGPILLPVRQKVHPADHPLGLDELAGLVGLVERVLAASRRRRDGRRRWRRGRRRRGADLEGDVARQTGQLVWLDMEMKIGTGALVAFRSGRDISTLVWTLKKMENPLKGWVYIEELPVIY